MRKREIERNIIKAQKAIEKALKPLPICCKRRIVKAIIVLHTDCEIK